MLRSLGRQQHLRHGMAVSVTLSVSLALVSSGDTINEPYQRARPSTSTQICGCENQTSSTAPLPTTMSSTPQPLSRLTLLLHASKLYPHSYLPTPRLLTPRDPLFNYPELKRGLLRRRNDEETLKAMLSSSQLMEARESQDQEKMNVILQNMNAIVYGEGITPQSREDRLMQYGCTGFTDDILHFIVQTYGHRGVIEVGAGNGQWSRALSEEYHRSLQKQPINNSNTPKLWEFILAYDNMEELPLSPKVYHKNTIPAKKYFFDNVQRGSGTDAVQAARGRALLLVYPPPGPMALETVLSYLAASPGYSGSCKNDTVVYVGEGRGGANADEAFFDYFISCNQARKDTEKSQWVLEKVMHVLECPGGKGYEKMFVFRRT